MAWPPTGALLARVMRAVTRRPWWTVAACLALAVAGTIITARGLSFQSSSVQLLPPSHVYVQRFKEYLRDFGELNDIVIAIEAPTVPRAQSFADRLAAEIKKIPGAGRVAYRVDADAFKGRALLYLSTEDLDDIADKIRLHRPFIERYAASPTVASLFEGLGEEIARGLALGFFDLGLDGGDKKKLDAGFIDTLLTVVADGAEARGTDGSPWARVFTGAGGRARSGYFMSSDDRLLFVLVEPRRDAHSFTDNEHFLEAIRGAIQTLRAREPDIQAGATGTPALSNDEMLTAFHDSSLSSILAFVLTLGLMFVVMRRVVAPIVMFVVLQVSLAWTFGIVTLTVGHLTVFSVMFISVVIGIGIDYAIYVFLRYEEERVQGREPGSALAVAATQSGPGILFGALAAAGTFGVLVLTEFRGIQEFGFIAAVAILMSFVAMITLYPALLVLWPPRVRAQAAITADVPALRAVRRRPLPVVVVAAVLTVASALALPSVTFDYSRLNLQAPGTESVIWERKIMQSRRSGFAALAAADSLDELAARQTAFSALPSVAEVMSVLKLIPSDQDAKIAAVHRLAPLVAGVRFGEPAQVDTEAVVGSLTTLRDRLGIASTEAEGQAASAATLRSAHERANKLLARLQNGDRVVLAGLGSVQTKLRDDFASTLRQLQDNLQPTPITVRDLPPELSRKFIGQSGRLLMLIYPSIDTWEREGAREFVRQLRTVDPAVTGSPVISYEASRLVEVAYIQGTVYAGVLVLACAIFMLRSPVLIAMALVPAALGTLWTIGCMHVFGLTFNLANVWGLPLLIGASAEYGFNVVLRYRERAGTGEDPFPRGAMIAVALNGLTTVAGFGSMMVARHQGIFGLGLMLTIGSVAALVCSLVLVPALLYLVHPGKEVACEVDGSSRSWG